MGNLFEKIFGKKKQETVFNNINSQNNINNQDATNQNIIEPEQPITFNQNINVGNQTVNPLGFQPTLPTNNIQNNLNNQEYNLNPQPIDFNNQVTEQQVSMINKNYQPELNVIPQPIQNQIQPQQQIVPSNEVNNVANQQPITFNQAQQNEVINVIPTLGTTPNPTDPNQNNVNNQNM